MNRAAVAYSDTIDRARYHIFTKRELECHYRDSFRAVVDEYVKTKQRHPVTCHSYDPDGLDRSRGLSYALVEFLVDVESATAEALKNREDLQATWFAVALGQPVDTKLENETITRCGRVYVSRKLEPYRYFFRDKYPKCGGR